MCKRAPPGSLSSPSSSATTGDVCALPSRECKHNYQPWRPTNRAPKEHALCCHGCFLPRTIRTVDDTAFDTHGIGRFGPARCPWTLVIKVALLQVGQARRLMSPTQAAFAPALQQACGVQWETMGFVEQQRRGDGQAARALSVCERTVPRELLDWGARARPSGVDKVARWLTSGDRVPNVVLFAPVLARGLGLNF